MSLHWLFCEILRFFSSKYCTSSRRLVSTARSHYQVLKQMVCKFRAHSPSFPLLHLRHSSFSSSSLALPTSQLILQPFCSFTYITAHSSTLLLFLLHHRIFTYVTWRATHGRRQHGWKLPEISLTSMIEIHIFCKPSPQGMKADATSWIRRPSDNQWHGVHRLPHVPKRLSAKNQRSTLLINLFNSNGTIHKEFLLEGQTVNAAVYVEVLKWLLQRIWHVRNELYRTGKWSLLHDVCLDIAIYVCNFLAKELVTVLEHSVYSPDLVPVYFFLFPHLKGILKSTYFADILNIQRHVTSVLRSIPKDAFCQFTAAVYTQSKVYCGQWRILWRW